MSSVSSIHFVHYEFDGTVVTFKSLLQTLECICFICQFIDGLLNGRDIPVSYTHLLELKFSKIAIEPLYLFVMVEPYLSILKKCD